MNLINKSSLVSVTVIPEPRAYVPYQSIKRRLHIISAVYTSNAFPYAKTSPNTPAVPLETSSLSGLGGIRETPLPTMLCFIFTGWKSARGTIKGSSGKGHRLSEL